MIRFPCPKCDATLKVAADRAGQKIKCPKCEHPVTVPEAHDELPVADSEEGTHRPASTRDGSARERDEKQSKKGWYYSTGGTRHGPVSEAELRTLAADGELEPADLVWQKGMDKWVPAAEVDGLFPEDDLPPPLPDEQPPPVSRRTSRKRADDVPPFVWEAWQVWVFMLVTLGLFGFYLIPSWAKQMERITGKPRMPFGAHLALGVLTLSVSLLVVEVVYAFQLAKHGERTERAGSKSQLGWWVLSLNVVGLVWSVATNGIGFIVGGAVLGVLATWLVQAEINRYAVGDGPTERRAELR